MVVVGFGVGFCFVCFLLWCWLGGGGGGGGGGWGGTNSTHISLVHGDKVEFSLTTKILQTCNIIACFRTANPSNCQWRHLC